MEDFNHIFTGIIKESRIAVTKKREFYPRAVENAGGLSQDFIDCLHAEFRNLNENGKIPKATLLKAIRFELNGH